MELRRKTSKRSLAEKVAFHQMARAVKRELVSVLKTCTISQIYSALRSQSRVDTTLITKLIVEHKHRRNDPLEINKNFIDF